MAFLTCALDWGESGQRCQFKWIEGLPIDEAGRKMKKYEYPAKIDGKKKKGYLGCLCFLRIARDDIA